MPKVFKVEKAFLSTEADKKTPQMVNTKGGEMHKYMVQFENQGIQGWIGILKKPGNVINPGDEMYGVIEENQWGKPQFTRMQLPQDGSVQLKTSNAPAATEQKTAAPAQSNSNGTVDEKLDYIIGMLEAHFQVERPAGAQKNSDTSPTDIDDGPINLDDLDI